MVTLRPHADVSEMCCSAFARARSIQFPLGLALANDGSSLGTFRACKLES